MARKMWCLEKRYTVLSRSLVIPNRQQEIDKQIDK